MVRRKRQVNRRAETSEQLKDKLNAYSIQLSDSQCDQMASATALISEKFPTELSEVFCEAGEGGDDFEDCCRKEWFLDQERNKSGSTQNRWSIISYRVALAVFARSTAAYEALSQFPIMTLPSVRQLQRFQNQYYDFRPGISEEYIARQSEQYWKEQAGKRKPGKGSGVLIFDEVKVR